MRRSMNSPQLPRATSFEPVEARLYFSGQTLYDFSLDQTIVSNDDDLLNGVHLNLADVHDAFGVNFVRDQFGLDGSGQTVVVVDSGIAYDHYALGGGLGEGKRVVGGWDFSDENDADPYDDGPAGFHGTHVAGIIGSQDAVHTGVAPGVDLVALRVFNDLGQGRFDWVENALDWIHDHQLDFRYPITTVNMSLGATWNESTLPSWAALEDELSQLRQDGIFISVAAGNSFQDYLEPGLSYPAVSSHVVPVASVTNQGVFSGFSQRHDRVIAAPGQSITSTAPDYLFDFDGTTNDFATASGTSMAAPYVAGASVLVRQAMDFVGYVDVTQDTIYSHLRNTADQFSDSVTGGIYYRLNLESALTALMPSDDFGSSAFAAHPLGQLRQEVSLRGTIGSLDDQDYFSFVAAENGVVEMTVRETHDMQVDWQLENGIGSFRQGVFSFDVTQGESYVFSVGTAAGIGHYDLDVRLTPSIIDWGTVSRELFADQQVTPSGTWYQFEAGRTGIVTLEAFSDDEADGIGLAIYDANRQMLGSCGQTSQYQRLDIFAGQGEQFYVRANGAPAVVDFQLTNLVAIDGDTVNVFGTQGDDTFSAVLGSAGSVHSVDVEDIHYEFDSSVISTLNFYGGNGSDSLAIVGSDLADAASLTVGSAEWSAANYQGRAIGFEIMAFVGGGGQDSVVLHDSLEDDFLHATPTAVTLSGSQFENRAQGFERVEVHSRSGADVAQFHDSPGSDVFRATSNAASMTANGYQVDTWGFDVVEAYSLAGGNDQAYFYGSPERDDFRADSNTASLRSEHYSVYASFFAEVRAFAGSGGNDRAFFHDSSGDDLYHAGPTGASLTGASYYIYAGDFGEVHAYSTAGGYDRAYLYDSNDNEDLWASSSAASLRGHGFFVYGSGFDEVRAYASAGGNDRAFFYDSPGDDIFRAGKSGASLSGSGYFLHGMNFDSVHAYATAGGSDQAYLLGTQGDDVLLAGPTAASLSGDGFYNFVSNFDRVHSFGNAGGNDRAYLFGSDGDDFLNAGRSALEFSGPGFDHHVDSFEAVSVKPSDGHDQADFHDVGQEYTFTGHGTTSEIRNSVSTIWTDGMDVITAIATVGATPTADLQAVDFTFHQIGSWT